MVGRLLAVMLTVAGLAAPSSAPAAAPQLQVVGNRLIDAATGQQFVPRGVNWPSFEYACFYGYAYSQTEADGSVSPNAEGAAVIASWHANTVRIPLNEACWLGVDGQPSFGSAAGYRSAVKQWVDTLHAAGLAVIVDLHWSAPPGTPAEGQRAAPDERSDDFWASVATTFKDDPSILFDVFNEPYSRVEDDGTVIFDLTWSCWRNGGCQAPNANDQQPFDGNRYVALGHQQLVDAIRGTGAKQPIIVAGRDYGNDLGEWLANKPADDQLVADFHNYKSQVCHTVACWDSVIAPVAAQVPVVSTEFGQSDCQDDHLNAFMNWADGKGIGYLAWAWWVLNDKPACSEFVLLSKSDGTPRAPNGTALKAHLAALAAAGAGSGPAPPGGVGNQGPGPDGGSGPSGSIGLALAGKRTQKLAQRVRVRVACQAQCSARLTARLVVRRRKRRTFRLRAVNAVVQPGAEQALALRLPSAARRAARRALRRGRAATVTISVQVLGAGDDAASATRRVKLTL
jgi:hypothetical protein